MKTADISKVLPTQLSLLSTLSKSAFLSGRKCVVFFDVFDDTESGYSLELSDTLDESNRLVIDFSMVSSQVE
jgi:hypothetical protein